MKIPVGLKYLCDKIIFLFLHLMFTWSEHGHNMDRETRGLGGRGWGSSFGTDCSCIRENISSQSPKTFVVNFSNAKKALLLRLWR